MLTRKIRWALLTALSTVALAGCAYSGTVRGEGDVLATEIALSEVRHVEIGGRAVIHQDLAGPASVNPLRD